MSFKSKLYLIVLFALITGTNQTILGQSPIAIPAVREWKSYGGSLELTSPSIVVDKKYSSELLPIAKIFSNEIQLVTGKNITVEEGSSSSVKGNIYLTIDDNKIAKEGYRLKIKKGVEVNASQPVGIFYATRTLLQLMTQNPVTLPKGIIEDEPKYEVRSVLLDVARKFIPYNELKDWVTALSYFKINEIHLHFNDNSFGDYGAFRVEMKTIKGLTSTDGFYTQEEIRELQDFAKLRGITIVPEMDTPGHSRALTTLRPELAHPELGGNYLDINKEETYRYVEKVLDEVVPLFDAEHFHIGTDEYRINLLKDKEERLATGEKFRQYINHFSKYLEGKGKTTRIWSGYEHMPGTTEPDKSVVIDMWVTSDALNKSKAGYKIINSTHLWTYIVPGAPYYGVSNKFLYEEWSPNKFSKKENGILSPDDPNLLGAKLHVWNDKGPTGYTTNEIARLTMPSVLVMAEQFWGTKGASDYESFTQIAKKVLPEGDDFDMVFRSRAAQREDNVSCGAIPGTSFLQRKAASEGETVWKLEKPTHFISNTSHELDSKAANLEYPWTATYTITRTKDLTLRGATRPAGHEALMSSELGVLFLDYNYELRDKKTKEIKEMKKGVAFIRSWQEGAATPGDNDHADIGIFNYQVPLNTKVKLTFVGHQNKTELYVNGELVDTINKQMVCPLETLGGDRYTKSFLGTLHEAAIYDVTAPNK